MRGPLPALMTHDAGYLLSLLPVSPSPCLLFSPSAVPQVWSAAANSYMGEGIATRNGMPISGAAIWPRQLTAADCVPQADKGGRLMDELETMGWPDAADQDTTTLRLEPDVSRLLPGARAGAFVGRIPCLVSVSPTLWDAPLGSFFGRPRLSRLAPPRHPRTPEALPYTTDGELLFPASRRIMPPSNPL